MFFFLTIVLSAKAQYSFQWKKFFGYSTLFEASSIALTPEGNILIIGLTRDKGHHTLIQKITPQAEVIWSKSLSNHKTVVSRKVIVLPDSSIVLVGYMRDWEDTKENIWLAKLDSNGTLLWERAYYQFGYSIGVDVKMTKDKGFIIAANKFVVEDNNFDWLVLKVDSLGFIQWYKTSGTRFNDNLNAVAILPNSFYVVGGFVSQNRGGQKVLAVLVYDSLGEEVAYNEFRNLGFSEAMDIIATEDSEIVIVGFKIDSFYLHDIVVLKLDQQTNVIWEKVYNMTLRQIPFSMIQTFNKNFVIIYNILLGEIPYADIGILEIDPQGNIVFSRLMRSNSDDFVAQVTELKDNSLALLTTNFIIGRGWVIGLTKCKSKFSTDLIFLFPKKKFISTKQDLVNIKACVKTYMKPKKIDVYVNNKKIETITNFTLVPQKNCAFAFEIKLKLNFGLNIIKFETTDYKDFKFVRKRVIIYIPLPEKFW